MSTSQLPKGKMIMGVGTASFILSANESAFVLPGQIHSYKPIDGCDCTADLCIFSPDCLPELYQTPRTDFLRTPILSPSLNAPTVADIFAVSDDKFLAKAKIYELASAYLRGNPVTDGFTAFDEFAVKFLDYLAAHYTEPITLRSISDVLGYNYRYLSGLIKHCFGTSFAGLIGEYCTSYACELLGKTDLGITEISSRCGFESIRSFNRVFKQFCACTPSKYRKSLPHGQ